MPTALDRLIASPSALRVLRSIVNAPELPAVWIPAVNCCSAAATPQRRWKAAYTKGKEKEFKSRKRIQLHVPSQSSLSVPDLEYEAAVNQPVGPRPRRVDNPDEPNKIQLWTELLQYQHRVHGIEGIRYIWRGMSRRGVVLPTTAKEGAPLWGTLIRHRGIVEHVLAHAAEIYKTTGNIYPGLYEECIAWWLPRRSSLALKCHEIMVDKLQLKKLPLHKLATRATNHPESLKVFSQMYISSTERDIYDYIVPPLCEKGEVAQARQWHITCFQRNDLPSAAVRSRPMIKQFTTEYEAFASPVSFQRISVDGETIVKHHVFANSEGIPRYEKYNHELMQRLIGRKISDVRFDDSFCARLFATRAFPVSSIIKGLRLVSVSEIGAQALRELALRAEPISELRDFYQQLEDVRVSIRPSTFTLAIEKFSMENKYNLVRSLLETDQHPDVLEDKATQAKLLDHYLQQEDWAQAHRTLAILTLFHNDVKTESWNLMLQARIRQQDPGRITQVLIDMRENNVTITKESIVAIRSMLRHRARGHQPVTRPGDPKSKFDDLRFVTRTLMTILESGNGYVTPWQWREILRRYGMLGRLRELRRLSHWLLQWYAIRSNTTFSQLPRPLFLDQATTKLQQTHHSNQLYFNMPPSLSQKNTLHPLRQLFSPAWQRGVIVWGFRAGLLPNATLEQSLLSGAASHKRYRQQMLQRGMVRRLDWSAGLRLLVELRDAGVLVQRNTVVKACTMQFRVLFGGGRSAKVANRVLRKVNRGGYVGYVREVNRLWGCEIFRETGSLGAVVGGRMGDGGGGERGLAETSTLEGRDDTQKDADAVLDDAVRAGDKSSPDVAVAALPPKVRTQDQAAANERPVDAVDLLHHAAMAHEKPSGKRKGKGKRK